MDNEQFLRATIARLAPREAAAVIAAACSMRIGAGRPTASSGTLVEALITFLDSPAGQELLGLAMQLLVSALTPKDSPRSGSPQSDSLVATAQAVADSFAAVATAEENLAADSNLASRVQSALVRDAAQRASAVAGAHANVAALKAILASAA